MTYLSSPKLELWLDATAAQGIVQQSELPTISTWQSWFDIWLRVINPTVSPIGCYEVSLVLTDDATIQQLNATYRHQDKVTDVLAFAAQETEIPGAQVIYRMSPLPLGDVIISVETAQRQRHDDNYSLLQELAWLAAHGLLHLLGWEHPNDESLKIMLEKQRCLLKQIELIV